MGQSAPEEYESPLAVPPVEGLKITDLKVLKFTFPGRKPVMRNSIIELDGGNRMPTLTQLEIHTSEGIIGRSHPKGGVDFILSRLTPKLIGRNPFDIEGIWDDLYRLRRKPVANGEYIKAMGSVDMALWDIIGKTLQLPVHRVLGTHNTHLYVYAAGGYYEDGKTTVDLCEEMVNYVEGGFRAVKMKVGGASFREDVERVREVRKAIGPDIDLMLDANNCWLPYEAVRFGKFVEEFDPFWFEEPVVANDYEGCAEVRRKLRIPITAGENSFTRWECRELITAKSADILNPDTVKTGGITEFRKIAALCSTFNIPVAPHGDPHMAAHLLAATPNALVMETYPEVFSRFNPALELYPVKDGYIDVPDRPGLGIDPDPDCVKKYAEYLI